MTSRIIVKNLHHAVHDTPSQKQTELQIVIESETQQLRRLAKSILSNTKVPPIQKTSSMVWNTTARILRLVWRHRHRATFFAFGGVVGGWCAAILLVLQLSVASTIVFRTFVKSRGSFSDLEILWIKTIIMCMRVVRRTMELPFDIPVFLVKIVHGHIPTKREAQQVLENAKHVT